MTERWRKLHLPREWKPLLEAAIKANWMVEKTNGNHIRWKAPSGATVFTSCSPSDHRAMLNARSPFRRQGLNV